jgi:hypothetical protein
MGCELIVLAVVVGQGRAVVVVGRRRRARARARGVEIVRRSRRAALVTRRCGDSMSRRYDSYAPNDRGGSTTLAGPAARCGHSAREQKRAGADQAVRRGRPGWWAALRTANRRRARRGRASRKRLPSKRAGAPRSAVPRCLGATPTGGQAAPSGARERDAGGAGCPKGSRNWPRGGKAEGNVEANGDAGPRGGDPPRGFRGRRAR